jgi:hypothetical protein
MAVHLILHNAAYSLCTYNIITVFKDKARFAFRTTSVCFSSFYVCLSYSQYTGCTSQVCKYGKDNYVNFFFAKKLNSLNCGEILLVIYRASYETDIQRECFIPNMYVQQMQVHRSIWRDRVRYGEWVIHRVYCINTHSSFNFPGFYLTIPRIFGLFWSGPSHPIHLNYQPDSTLSYLPHHSITQHCLWTM